MLLRMTGAVIVKPLVSAGNLPAFLSRAVGDKRKNAERTPDRNQFYVLSCDDDGDDTSDEDTEEEAASAALPAFNVAAWLSEATDLSGLTWTQRAGKALKNALTVGALSLKQYTDLSESWWIPPKCLISSTLNSLSLPCSLSWTRRHCTSPTLYFPHIWLHLRRRPACEDTRTLAVLAHAPPSAH